MPFRRGRHPASFIGTPSSPVRQESVELQTKFRLSFPSWLAGDLDWFTAPYLLGVMAESGRLLVHSAAELARVEKRYDELAESPSEENLKSIQRLLDRYLKLPAEAGLRITIPSEARLHLSVRPRDPVYVLRYPTRLEVWSTDYRQANRAEEDSALDDLP
jgi:hypothetical protein